MTGVTRLFRMGMQQGYAPAQPIAFSHKLHAGDNKVPCLYCHYGARSSRHAGIPSSSVCMNCHGLLEKQTVEIERFKEAAQLDRPLVAWVKVHNLPDFVYFNHSRHILSGKWATPQDACHACHGEVEKMTRVEQVSPLTMGWCLECHRERAGIPTHTLERATRRFSEVPKPVTGTDCASCHY
ncbi:MAG TPA: cytochrome c3 family protein [Kofleriaceae bacterium]|nr:cytochrome c3 family protein [Kofleriaceae bacterium]